LRQKVRSKMGNAKKGHNKTGREKVVAHKVVYPPFFCQEKLWPIFDWSWKVSRDISPCKSRLTYNTCLMITLVLLQIKSKYKDFCFSPIATPIDPNATHLALWLRPPRYEMKTTTAKLPISNDDTTSPDSALRKPYLTSEKSNCKTSSIHS